MDADVSNWAALQIIEARDAGIETSRLLVATPYETPSFAGRETSGRDYLKLKAAFNRLQSTSVATSICRLTSLAWYNRERPHLALRGRTPDGVCAEAFNGGNLTYHICPIPYSLIYPSGCPNKGDYLTSAAAEGYCVVEAQDPRDWLLDDFAQNQLEIW
jgi:hypothetical protein